MSIFDKGIILNVSNLSAGYGKRQVLFDVSFTIRCGHCILLVGGNGSGKSTLLKAIYGLVSKWNNSGGLENSNPLVQFDSEDITYTKPYNLIQKGIIYVPQKNNTFEQLTVRENLEVSVTYLPKIIDIKKRIIEVFERLPQLLILKDKIAFHLSGGEKQQLALGMALMQQPKMILLDEPAAGLAPNTWKKNLEVIKMLNKQGITFLIVEHRVKETIQNVNNVLTMRLGKIVDEARE